MVFSRALPGTICTGDTLTTPLIRYEFFAPSDQWVLDAIFGFFDDYTWPAKFTPCGEVGIDQAAVAFSGILASLRRSALNIGTIVAYAGSLPSDPAVLPADGASYLRTDFPDLFAVIGTVWGADDADHFNVPDLRTRTLVMQGVTPDSSVWNLGDLIGEENHTLSLAETPGHTHTDLGHTHVEGNAAPVVGAAITGVPIPSAVPTVGITGTGSANLTSVGGDGAHNNTQLAAVIIYAIIAF